MERLCETYWYPIYAHIRTKGHTVQEAEDLTQEFFARLLEHNWLNQVDRKKGKFRTYLLAAVNHFLYNEWRRVGTVKRGDGKPLLSLDDEKAERHYAREANSNLTPEAQYERRWAVALLNQALARLRRQYEAMGKAALFDHLKPFLDLDAERTDYESATRATGMNAGAVAVAVHRLRRRCRRTVEHELALTLANPADVQAEVRWLFSVLTK